MKEHINLESIQDLMSNLLNHPCQSFPALSSDSTSVLYNLAYYLYENGKYHDAKQVFRFLTVSEPFDRRFWMGLAASYQMLRSFGAALECYGLAAMQAPDDPLVHLHAADCFFANGQALKALQTLESAIASAKKINDSALLSRLQLMRESWQKKHQGDFI